MVVSGSGKRMWGKTDCSKPKYKRRKMSARRDFPRGLVQFAAASNHVAIEYANPVVFYQFASANSNHVEKVENVEESEYDLEGVESDDVLSQPISELPEILYARHDHPVVLYQVARKICARRDFPEAFYANSSHVVKAEREESESDPEEIKAVDSDDDLDAKTEKSKCELEEIDGSYNANKLLGFEPICSVDKMEPEMQDKKCVNQIVGSTEPLDSNRTRGDYLQHWIAHLDHMAATLMQMKQQGAFKKRSAV